ncbi:hypothetical protein GCM10017559_82950 [Streptosporangium longisporum]|uniref:Uncharacterized protein n=1 Tax=Streptosporangium longisporum TaxID=46187 RepID=A0ABP6LHG6_9ACTN
MGHGSTLPIGEWAVVGAPDGGVGDVRGGAECLPDGDGAVTPPVARAPRNRTMLSGCYRNAGRCSGLQAGCKARAGGPPGPET